MSKIDIFNVQRSKVSKGLEGKSFYIHANNRTGKTMNASKFPKPLFLSAEMGLNAISDIPFIPIDNWATFAQAVRQLTSNKTVDKAKELYSTIVIDTVSALAMLCQKHVCENAGVEELSAVGAYGKGHALYGQEFYKQVIKLFNAGYTVVALDHSKTELLTDELGEEYTFTTTTADRRSGQMLMDICDVIIHLQNPPKVDGEETLSTAFLKGSKNIHCGTRFVHLPDKIEEFSTAKLEQAMIKAVEKQEKESGVKSVSYSEQQEMYKPNTLNYDEVLEQTTAVAKQLFQDGKISRDELQNLLQNKLGVSKLSDTTSNQVQALELLRLELEEMI
jgi:hypothetical protein